MRTTRSEAAGRRRCASAQVAPLAPATAAFEWLELVGAGTLEVDEAEGELEVDDVDVELVVVEEEEVEDELDEMVVVSVEEEEVLIEAKVNVSKLPSVAAASVEVEEELEVVLVVLDEVGEALAPVAVLEPEEAEDEMLCASTRVVSEATKHQQSSTETWSTTRTMVCTWMQDRRLVRCVALRCST